MRLHIDIDVMNEYRPGNPPYPLVKRGVYYGAREIGRQLGTLTETTDYGRLEKVYSIWICNDVPKALRGTVSRYDIRKTDVIGAAEEPEEDYDLLSVIIARRGDGDGVDGIFDYLEGLFSSNMPRISKYVDAGRSEKVRKEVEAMSGLGAALISKGEEQGIKQGIQQGIEQGREYWLDEAVRRLADHYMSQDASLGREEAIEMAAKILR